MDTAKHLDISDVVDNHRMSRLAWIVLAICFAATLSDGYALLSASIAAPGIVKEFRVPRAAISPIFSTPLIGMLLGSLLNGYLGDRYGRKRGLIFSLTIVGVSSLGCAYVASLQQLIWVRFVMGFGIGSILPHVTAMMSEFMPKKVRGTFTTYAFMGITMGGVVVGLLGSKYFRGDWRGLFALGGIVPLALLPVAGFFLPESLKYLALRPERWNQLRYWLTKLDCGLDITPDTVFALHERSVKVSTRAIFAEELAVVTPALWLCFACIMLVNFFINSWIVLILRDMGFSEGAAAATASLYHIGGICGGLLMGVALDAVGPVALTLFTLFGCLAAGSIAVPGMPRLVTSLLVASVGLSVLGTQVGMSALSGLIYPTAVRSKGAGFAQSVGRLGAISGPMLAGWLLSDSRDLLGLFIVPIIPLSIAAASFFAITRFLARGESQSKHPEQAHSHGVDDQRISLQQP